MALHPRAQPPGPWAQPPQGVLSAHSVHFFLGKPKEMFGELGVPDWFGLGGPVRMILIQPLAWGRDICTLNEQCQRLLPNEWMGQRNI